MLDEHTWDAVDKKTDDSQQSPLAGFSINCYELWLTSKRLGDVTIVNITHK